jgi:hypothetical protein
MRSEVCDPCPDTELRNQNPNESYTHYPENGRSSLLADATRLHSGEHGDYCLLGYVGCDRRKRYQTTRRYVLAPRRTVCS